MKKRKKGKKKKILTYCYNFDRDNLKADGLGLLITFRGREFQMGITCKTTCSIAVPSCGLHVIKSVNTHLRIIIFIAVLHNAQNKFQIGLQPDLPSVTVGLRPTTSPTRTYTVSSRWFCLTASHQHSRC